MARPKCQHAPDPYAKKRYQRRFARRVLMAHVKKSLIKHEGLTGKGRWIGKLLRRSTSHAGKRFRQRDGFLRSYADSVFQTAFTWATVASRVGRAFKDLSRQLVQVADAAGRIVTAMKTASPYSIERVGRKRSIAEVRAALDSPNPRAALDALDRPRERPPGPKW